MNLILHLTDEFLCILVTLRRNPHEPDQPFGSIQKTLTDLCIAGNDIPFILCTFFRLADKRPFHIHSHQICRRPAAGSFCFFLNFPLILRRNRQDSLQLFNRKRHSRRRDRSHTDRGFILGNLCDRFFRPVAEVITAASVEMQINQTRNRITAFPVEYLLFTSVPFGLSTLTIFHFFDPTVLNRDLTFPKFLLFRVNLYITDNHITITIPFPEPSVSRIRLLFRLKPFIF